MGGTRSGGCAGDLHRGVVSPKPAWAGRFGMNRVLGVTAVSVDGAPAGWLGSDGVRTFLL